jgi:hypothetical protein
MFMMTARKHSACAGDCGRPIKPGDRIVYAGKGKAYHSGCEPTHGRRTNGASLQEDYPCSDLGYEDQCAERCGF